MMHIQERLQPSKVYAPGICAEVLRDPDGYVRYARLIRLFKLKGKALQRELERIARDTSMTRGQVEYALCLLAVAKAEGRYPDDDATGQVAAMLRYQRSR